MLLRSSVLFLPLKPHRNKWWDVAIHVIRTEATAYHKEVAPPQAFNMMGLVLTSTKHRVCPQAWTYLRSKGYEPPSKAAAYSILVTLFEKDRNNKAGTILLGKLKGILGGEEMNVQSGTNGQKQIHKLMSELQCRGKLGAVRDKTGAHLTQPLKIATALREHWEGVSKQGLMSVDACTNFLQSLPLPAIFKTIARALFRPLTQEIVNEVLDRLHSNVSPGDDGVRAKIYQRFAEVFAPAMLQVAKHCFHIGIFYDDWGMGIINSIPKVAGTCMITKLRPITLQEVKKKWLMTILCIQVEQMFQQLTHSRQVGCVKGRQMINHIWGVWSTFEPVDRCVMVSFDFSNAFPTLSHACIQAVLRLIQRTAGYVLVVLAIVRMPYQFCVGRGVVREVNYMPKAGIGQGDPFSPVLFSFCVAFVLHLLSEITNMDSFMYLDDLCAIVEGPQLGRTLGTVQEAMSVFAKFPGQVLHLIKCGVVIKGDLTPAERSQVELSNGQQLLCGIPVVDSVKYLRVHMGNLTSDAAFAFPLGEAQRRARCMTAYGLSIKEKLLLLKTWILPCVLLTARAWSPSEIAIRALRHVYHTALGTDSWGVTLDNLAQPRELGDTPSPPKIWLHAQSGLPFHKLLQSPDISPERLVKGFRVLCTTYGVCLNAWALPYLQMGQSHIKPLGLCNTASSPFLYPEGTSLMGWGTSRQWGVCPCGTQPSSQMTSNLATIVRP